MTSKGIGNEPRPRRTKLSQLGILFVAVIMISGSLGYLIGAVDGPSGFPTVIEPGSMVAESDYTIFVDDGIYYARNGWSGEIDFQDSDASSLIQDCIDELALQKRTSIYIKSGIYNCTTTIFINTTLTLRGDGGDWLNYPAGAGTGWGTCLLGSTPGIDLLRVPSGFMIRVSDMVLSGGFVDQGSPAVGIYWGAETGINITGCNRVTFENLRIRGFEHYGVYIGNTTKNSHTVLLENCWLSNNGRDSDLHGAIYVYDGNIIEISHCCIEWNGAGVLLSGGYDNMIIGCTIEGNLYSAINSSFTDRIMQHVTISDVYTESNNVVEAPNMPDISIGYLDSHWSLYNLKLASEKTTWSLWTKASYTYLWDVRTIHATSKLYAAEGSDYCVAVNCYAWDIACAANITSYPGWTMIGERFANSGTATMASSSSSVVITHNIYWVPTQIIATGNTSETCSLWVDTITTTTFTVHANITLTSDASIYWWASV